VGTVGRNGGNCIDFRAIFWCYGESRVAFVAVVDIVAISTGRVVDIFFDIAVGGRVIDIVVGGRVVDIAVGGRADVAEIVGWILIEICIYYETVESVGCRFVDIFALVVEL